MTTIERVRAVFQEHFGADLLDRFADGKVTFLPASTGRRVELDSLDQTEFVMALEEEFGVTITDAQGERVASIDTAVQLIDELTAETEALPPIAKGQARAFLRCPTHGTLAWYDYVPYSFSTAIGVMRCGCDPKGAPKITEAEFHAACRAADAIADHRTGKEATNG